MFLLHRLRRETSTCCTTWMMPWMVSAGPWGSSSGCPCSGCTRWRPGGGMGGGRKRKRKRLRPSSTRKEENGRNDWADQNLVSDPTFDLWQQTPNSKNCGPWKNSFLHRVFTSCKGKSKFSLLPDTLLTLSCSEKYFLVSCVGKNK